MAVTTELVFRFACDWPDCRAVITIRGAAKKEDAVRRIRAEGWTEATKAWDKTGHGSKHHRCAAHSFTMRRNRWQDGPRVEFERPSQAKAS